MKRKKSKLGRIIKGNRGLSIYIICIVALFAYLVIRIIPEKKTLLTRETLLRTSPGVAYVFRQEDYAVIFSEIPITFDIGEGEKISAATLLTDDVNITTDKYTNEKLSAISLLRGEMGLSSSALYKHISDLTEQLLVCRCTLLLYAGNEAEKSTLENLKQSLNTAKIALSYLGLSNYELQVTEENLRASLGAVLPLTAQNLNFSQYGNITYNLDGYESEMGMDDLMGVSGEYLDKLSSMAPVIMDIEGRYTVKSIAADRLVVVIRASSQSVLSKEEDALKMYEQCCANRDMSEFGGYFGFLFDRIDLLNMFPTLRFYDANNKEYSGKLVQVEKTDTEKFYYIAIRKNVSAYNDIRIFSCDVTEASYDCYVADKSCLYQIGQEYYVDITTGGALRSVTEVFPLSITEQKVYFQRSENPSLYEGAELFLKGGK